MRAAEQAERASLAFSVSAPDDAQLAQELSVPMAQVTSALYAMNEPKESP